MLPDSFLAVSMASSGATLAVSFTFDELVRGGRGQHMPEAASHRSDGEAHAPAEHEPAE